MLWRAGRRAAPVLWAALAIAAVYVLAQRLQTFTWDQLIAAISAFPPVTIVISVALCLAAFIILSAYEYAAVRNVTGRSLLGNAAVTSWIAHSIGHVIGAALLSGGALRYRRYAAAGMTVREVSSITIVSAMPYVVAAGWLLDATMIVYSAEAAAALHISEPLVFWLGWLGLAKDIGWLVLVATRRKLRFMRWSLQLPTLSFTFLQIVVGIAEIVLVAAIMYVFMPPTLGLGLVAFTGIYLIAATVAQLSHVPAGIGVLEAALLLMLPNVPTEQLLAGIVCYRIVFELFPLAVGAALLLRAEMRPALVPE